MAYRRGTEQTSTRAVLTGEQKLWRIRCINNIDDWTETSADQMQDIRKLTMLPYLEEHR